MKAKRRTALAAKKASKLAGYRKGGHSAYALKARQNARGNFSPRSPFRSVVTVIQEDVAEATREVL